MTWATIWRAIQPTITRIMHEQGRKATGPQIGKVLGVDKDKIYAWGHGQSPKREDLEKLVKIFGLSAHFLVTGEGDPEDDPVRNFAEARAGYESRCAQAMTRAAEAREYAAGLREQLASQQDRILRAVTRELRAEAVPDVTVLRVHAAIIDYDADLGGHEKHNARHVTEPGDAGARRPQGGKE